MLKTAKSIATEANEVLKEDAVYISAVFTESRATARQQSSKDVSLEQKYKVKVFFNNVDKFTASLSSRFSQLNIYKRKFYLILRLPVLNQQVLEVERIVNQTQCELLNTVLGNVVDKTDLQAELAFFVNLTNRQQLNSALSILNYLVKQKITNTLPNLYTTLKIVATMPVSVASG